MAVVGAVAVAACLFLAAESRAATLAVGSQHTCVVTAEGGVKCWGDNSRGQLGAPSAGAFSAVPVDVTGLSSGVAHVAAGGAHTCAVLKTRAVKCWGGNGAGQLGDGTTTDRPEPVSMIGYTTNFGVGVFAGAQHTCVSLGDRILGGDPPVGPVKYGLQCTGAYGQPGAPSLTPQFLLTCKDVGCSATGSVVWAETQGPDASHSCVAINGTSLLSFTPDSYCWGDGTFGQLGNGSFDPALGLQRIQAVQGGFLHGGQAAGERHTCAVQFRFQGFGSDGVQCWGDNSAGQLGVPVSIATSNVPVDVAGFASGALSSGIAAGKRFSCAIVSATGTIRCWGDNAFGQLGDGTTIGRSTAEAVVGVTKARVMAAGGSHACARLLGDAVVCWGANDRGQLGDGTTVMRTTPVLVGAPAGDTPLGADIDGDRRSDLVVWRPSSGTWFWLTSSSGYDPAAAGAKQWGNHALGDTPLTGDIDADGRADLMVWRASTGTWHWLTSSSGYDYAGQGSRQWGNAALGDVPIAADMDGDAKSDLVIWRASTGTWHWLTSSSGYEYGSQGSVQWGNSALGDSPIVGDIDGDRRDDLAVWRASTGTWHWLTSASGYSYAAQGLTQWGSALYGDVRSLRDIDGDGRADLTIWRPTIGMWFWLTSTSGYSYAAQEQKQWGAQGDTPIPLDLDADAKLDLAVWRGASGTWFWLTSSTGFDYGHGESRQWGSAVSGVTGPS